MKRWLTLGYGAACYALFFVTFLYTIGFLGNFGVPKSIDSEPVGSFHSALAINALLLAVFAVQHSAMARPAFKHWWTNYVPQQVERSTYVLFSTAALALLMWQWQAVGGTVWSVDQPIGEMLLYGVYAAGWATVFISTFLINHFDLFGLRQVWLYFCGKQYASLPFRTPGPYRLVRHPLYVGWLTVSWATPHMTLAHLAFAVGVTAYILAAIPLEERDLVDHLGNDYREYRRTVPRLIPNLAKSGRTDPVGDPSIV